VAVQESAYTGVLVGHPGARLRVAQLRWRDDAADDGRAGRQGRHGRSGHVLEVMEYLEPRPEPADTLNARLGAAHLAFEVDSIDDVRPALEAAGAAFASEPVAITSGINRGGRTVYLRDPDGVALQLVEPPAAAFPIEEDLAR
jgi:lactoylglutathione lyase